MQTPDELVPHEQPEQQLQVDPQAVIQHFRQRCADLEFENVKLNVVVQQQREQINSLLEAMNESRVPKDAS